MNADTDGDGLSDQVEPGINLNPLSKDSDNNGIEDGNEDYDGDGLTNLEEFEYGTSPIVSDSDLDDLSDGDEIKKYGTDPLNIDTDDDGLEDGEEVLLGLDPKNKSSDGVVPDGERTFQQTLNASNYDEGVLDGAIYGPEISGIMGGLFTKHSYFKFAGNTPFDFNTAVLDIGELVTDYIFELHLKYDLTELKKIKGENYLKELLICKITGENGILPYDTKLEGTKLEAKVKGGGVYVVINSREFLSNLGIQVIPDGFHSGSSGNYSSLSNSLHIEAEESLSSLASNDLLQYMNETVNNSTSSALEIESNDHGRLDETITTDSQSALIVQENNVILPGEELSVLHINDASTIGAQVDLRAEVETDVVFFIDAYAELDSAKGRLNNIERNVADILQKMSNSNLQNTNYAIVLYDFGKNSGSESGTWIIKNSESNWFNQSEQANLVKTLHDSFSDVLVDKGISKMMQPSTKLFNVINNLDFRPNSNKFVVAISANRNYTEPGPNQHINRWMEELVLSVNDKQDAKDYMVDIVFPSDAALSGNMISEQKKIYEYWNKDYYKEIELRNIDEFSNEIYNDIIDRLEYNAILDDFQMVRLKIPGDSSVFTLDTDKDGVFDHDELSAKKKISVKAIVDKVLQAYELTTDSYKGKTELEVYKYNSNPVLKDTDYDGIEDGDINDKVKRDDIANEIDGNGFSGLMHFKSDEIFDFTVDYRLFFNDNTKYNRNLSVLGSVYSTLAYDINLTLNNGTNKEGNGEDIFKAYGLNDVEKINIDENEKNGDDLSRLIIGHRNVDYNNEKKEIIVIAIQGTDGSLQQWSSNFDVGANVDVYPDKMNPDWKNKNNHKGFDVASNRLLELISKYEEEYKIDKDGRVYYIVGHSRGGAIANIIGAAFENELGCKTFVYTFAAPNTTTSTNIASYKTIFNIVNEDDFVIKVPFTEWGFGKYGTNKPEIVSQSFYVNLHEVFPISYYYFNWIYVNDAVRELKQISINREELYAGLDDSANYEDDYSVKYDDKKEITIYTKQYIASNHKQRLYQSPAYVMQCLAQIISQEKILGKAEEFIIDYKNVAKNYKSVLLKVLGASVYLKDPHLQQTYYLLSSNLADPKR
jgi:hypothetical protein